MLNDFIDNADRIHNYIINNSDFLPSEEIEKNLIQLEEYIKFIQSASLRILQIYQACKSHVAIKKNVSDNFDPYPKNNDWVELYKERKTLNLIDGVPINANPVEIPEDVPNVKISWVRSLNQFAFRINGVLFRGNIGRIFTKGDRGSKIIACKKIQCKNIHNDKCRYYHDPLIYDGSNDIRNFTASSWIYTSDLSKKNNIYMRHYGDSKELRAKIKFVKNEEHIDTFMAQIAHDVLVSLTLSQFGKI